MGGGLPQRLADGGGSPQRSRPLLPLLQPRTAAPSPGVSDTSPGPRRGLLNSYALRFFNVKWTSSCLDIGEYLKLHLVVNDRGELLAFCLTPGNLDDRRPVPRLVKRLFGRLFGDRGYISHALAEELLVTQGLHLITKLRKNMRNRLLDLSDKLLLRKRAIIESIVDQLKNICQIEHSRHRSPLNFLVHLMAGLIAYCHQPKKPSLRLDPQLLLAA